MMPRFASTSSPPYSESDNESSAGGSAESERSIVIWRERASIPTHGRPLILMTLEHPMELECCGTTLALQKYQTALIPAAAAFCSVRAAETDAPFMFVTPPASPDQLATQLRAGGIAQPQIDAFTQQFAPL